MKISLQRKPITASILREDFNPPELLETTISKKMSIFMEKESLRDHT